MTEQTLDVAGWPTALSGLRIGFLTDLHRSATVSHEMIARAVDLVMARQPDLIIVGGDYVTNRDRRFVQPAAEALAKLAAPHGVFAVLGNHDDERDVPAALQATGFTVLRDARTQISIRGEPVDIAGLRYWTHRMADITRVVRGASPTLHADRAHAQAARSRRWRCRCRSCSAVTRTAARSSCPASGRWPRASFPIIAGAERRENTTVFVSRGVGTVYIPVRVNCPPEVASILHSLIQIRVRPVRISNWTRTVRHLRPILC